MISSTKDIFYLVLSLSVGAITVFMCWGMYYVLVSMRELRNIIKNVRERVDAVWHFVEKTKEKAESAATATTAISKAAVEIIDYVKERRRKKKTKIKKEKKSE